MGECVEFFVKSLALALDNQDVMRYNNKALEKCVCARSSADRVPGYEPVGRRFKSCWARQKNSTLFGVLFFAYQKL